MKLHEFLDKLANTEGPLSASGGVVRFKDGTSFDLGASIGCDAGLFARLAAKYPGKTFDMDEKGLIYLIDEDEGVAIQDPLMSSCGRFPSEDYHGLELADANALSEHNAELDEA